MKRSGQVSSKKQHDSGHQVPRVGTAESHKTSNVFDASDFIQWSLIQICPVGLGDRFFKRGGGGWRLAWEVPVPLDLVRRL